MDSVKVNLPPHLREKLCAEWIRRKSLKYPPISLDEIAEGEFIAGYQQAYSDLIAEMGPVVDALELYSNKSNFDFNDEGYEEIPEGPSICLGFGKTAQEALKHLKERIMP